ncbi:MAG: hypothetical protein NTW19_02875 [Planctomycetota bacterium]|nr:hypothetical protein [Planctomycetota bacterium]
MPTDAPIRIDNRLELFIDEFLIDRLEGPATLRLHSPTPREVVLDLDRAWEGCMCGYMTVMKVQDHFRIYYRGHHVDVEDPRNKGESLHIERPAMVCVAESPDGIHWTRPALDLLRTAVFPGNNGVWLGVGDNLKGLHGFSPFLDTNPACPPEQRFKAVGGTEGWPIEGLWGMTSPDGFRWSLLGDKALITAGAFDSHNLVFWDALRGQYRAYVRDFNPDGRGIRTATSDDFVNWTEPQWLDYPGAEREQLYTNNVQPYPRAPHLFVGFPARYVERPWSPSIEALPELEHRRKRAKINERFGASLTDSVFMSSRDGKSFRRWGEAFIRPGLRAEGNWTYGDNYMAWGMIPTPSDLPGGGMELSFYASEHYWRGKSTAVRRFTLRMDGFVSVNAPLRGGRLVTKPLLFAGSRLALNLSASAAGSVRVEILDAQGKSIEGFTADDAYETLGDGLAQVVQWKGGPSVARLAGQPIRLAMTIRDADVYAFQFVE